MNRYKTGHHHDRHQTLKASIISPRCKICKPEKDPFTYPLLFSSVHARFCTPFIASSSKTKPLTLRSTLTDMTKLFLRSHSFLNYISIQFTNHTQSAIIGKNIQLAYKNSNCYLKLKRRKLSY